MFFIYLSNTSTLSNVKYSIIKGKHLDILYKSLKEMPRRGLKKINDCVIVTNVCREDIKYQVLNDNVAAFI